MKSKTSWRTTAVGIFGMLLLAIGMVFVYFGKATLSELGTFASLLGPVLVFILSIVAKDDKVKSLTEVEVKSIETIIKKES